MIKPSKNPGRQGYRVSFRNPRLKGKVVTAGLGVRDQKIAEDICLDLDRLCREKSLWHNDKDPRLVAYDQRALDIFFGVASAAAAFAREKRSVGGSEVIAAAVREAFARGKALTGGIVYEVAGEIVAGEVEKLNTRLQDSEKELKHYKNRCHGYEEEIARLTRALNLHVKATMGEARDLWKKIFKEGKTDHTYKTALRALNSFISSLPDGEKAKLAKVAAGDLNQWVATVRGVPDKEALKRGEPGPELQPATKKQLLAYVGVFFSWAFVHYKLVENPMARTLPISGASRVPENIVAIRRLEDLTALIDGLKKWPYWRAWVATAIFAGPRWSEQAWLKIGDVYLEEKYMRIRSRAPGKHGPRKGTKTGRERNIPIEQTTFAPILAAHLELRKSEQRKKGATDWLFPSTLTEVIYERTKTPPGIWSSGSCFLDAWEAIVKERYPARTPEFWTYGPREWRHSFGTMLGMCGWTSLEISRVMGNSPDVAERHYVAASSAGRRWPFTW